MIETVILGSGCFWGAQDILRKIPGVEKTEVGYCGGELENPKYPQVKTGLTGHAEVTWVQFENSKVQLAQILDVFFRMHDPTTQDQQGNDLGSQYRSIIFYQDELQKLTVQKKIAEINKIGFWKKPAVTQVAAFKKYYPAEDYHQDYLVKNPNGYSCHFLRQF